MGPCFWWQVVVSLSQPFKAQACGSKENTVFLGEIIVLTGQAVITVCPEAQGDVAHRHGEKGVKCLFQAAVIGIENPRLDLACAPSVISTSTTGFLEKDLQPFEELQHRIYFFLSPVFTGEVVVQHSECCRMKSIHPGEVSSGSFQAFELQSVGQEVSRDRKQTHKLRLSWEGPQE